VIEKVMNVKISIDNLAPATTENELKALFSAYGNVADVNIVVDRTHQKQRGFVTMVTPEGARAAIQALNGKAMAEYTLIVCEAGAAQRASWLVPGTPDPSPYGKTG
jgi:RNA recognition motif-containing protein